MCPMIQLARRHPVLMKWTEVFTWLFMQRKTFKVRNIKIISIQTPCISMRVISPKL